MPHITPITALSDLPTDRAEGCEPQHPQLSGHSSAGFTLVELLVSILLLIVGVLAALSMVSTSLDANSKANVLTVKTALAQQVLEYLLSLDPENTACDPYLNQTPREVMVATGFANTYNLNRSTSASCPGTFVDDEGKSVSGTDRFIKGAGTFRADCTIVPDPVTGLTRIEVRVSRLPRDTFPVRLTSRKRVDR